MTDQQDDERRRFEAWARTFGDDDNGYSLSPCTVPGRTYANATTELVWQSWLARSVLPPTDEMVEAGARAILLDRLSPFLIREYQDNNSVGWIRACKESHACLTAALSPHGERVDG